MFELVRLMFTDVQFFIAGVVLVCVFIPFVALFILLVRAMWKDLW